MAYPKRKIEHRSLPANLENQSVRSTLNYLQRLIDEGTVPESATIQFTNYWDGDREIEFQWTDRESDESYNKRVQKWNNDAPKRAAEVAARFEANAKAKLEEERKLYETLRKKFEP